MAGVPIGIDLGTTYCCAAVVRDGKPQVIASRLGYTTIPSIVHYDASGQVTVGHAAERRMVLTPNQTIYGSKRLLGRTFQSDVREKYQPHFNYEIVADNDGMVAAKVCGTVVRLVEVSALILRELRGSVQLSLGEKVDRAVVTVPAYFNESQRACVREAGRMAGLDILRIINEPTAAALCYGYGRSEQKNVLVFDLGGGTFDLSLIRIDGDLFEVLAVGGNNFLGGIDFDRKLVDIVFGRIKATHGSYLTLDAVGRERLRAAAQEAKHTLSAQNRAQIEVPNFQIGGQKVDVNMPVTRAEFDDACKSLVDECMFAVSDVLMDAGLTPQEVDDILLVGGSTRIPIVAEALRTMFNKEPSKRVHPDEVVARGAAIAAYSHDRIDGAVLTDVVPTAIGIASRSRFIPVVARNTKLPHKVVATTEIAPGTTKLTLPVYQGESPDVRQNDYLGALEIDNLPGVNEALKCALMFTLDAECMLQVYAAIPQLNVKRSVALLTKTSAEEIAQDGGAERIRIVPPALETKLRGDPSAERPAAARMGGRIEQEEEEEEEDDKPGLFAGMVAWFQGLFARNKSSA